MKKMLIITLQRDTMHVQFKDMALFYDGHDLQCDEFINGGAGPNIII
jgi:hypothetical protein